MAATLFIVFSIGLLVAVAIGYQRNSVRSDRFLRAIEETAAPVKSEYVVLGRGLGYGFDFELSGPIRVLQGVLTLLPRYTPLYLPIARLLGRQDLLKLTFHCGDLLPAGVGALVHTNCKASWWSAIDRDDDWREEQVIHQGAKYTLYYYNPIIAVRLRSLLHVLEGIPNINQIVVDSRRGTITVFVTPRVETIESELITLFQIVFFLTGG